MHSHLETRGELLQNLGWGVTGVRVMWGNPQDGSEAGNFHSRWRDAIAAGTMLGPRMVVASAIMDGSLVREEPGRPPAPVVSVSLKSCRFARADSPRTQATYMVVYLVSANAELSQLVPLPTPPARGNPAFAACTTIAARDAGW